MTSAWQGAPYLRGYGQELVQNRGFYSKDTLGGLPWNDSLLDQDWTQRFFYSPTSMQVPVRHALSLHSAVGCIFAS